MGTLRFAHPTMHNQRELSVTVQVVRWRGIGQPVPPQLPPREGALGDGIAAVGVGAAISIPAVRIVDLRSDRHALIGDDVVDREA